MSENQFNKKLGSFLEIFFRFAIGLVMILFGFSKFYAFMPTPPMQPEAAKFIGALIATGYLWYLIGFIEIIGGSLLMIQKYMGWGLILLSPIVINITLYLLVLQQGVGAPPYLMSAFLIFGMSYLGIRNIHLFTGIIK